MNILILGATSAIAIATAEEFAKRGDTLFLAGRNTTELSRIANDLIIRFNISVYTAQFDAEAYATHELFWQETLTQIKTIDGVLLAFGYLGENDRQSQPDALSIINRNLTGAISILTYCANYFSTEKKGFIVGISSVAGDRGRQKNFVYDTAKAGLSTYLQGLRNYLFPLGVNVITIKPGFVDTPMTYGMPGMFCVAKPAFVAKKIMMAIDRSRDIVYIPFFWRYIMLVIKLIPEKIFKRLRI
jgi:decaprenylphospho-beta-D-erythro-pentofuranosid-2-ulose 2-reductase